MKREMKRQFLTLALCGMAIFCNVEAFAQTGKPILREEHKIVIDGVDETWSLLWTSPPSPACGPEDEDWMICPCMGFAYGESGNLVLLRKRPGKKEERLSLTALFRYGDQLPELGDAPRAVLRRWDVHEKDHKESDAPGFADRVRTRSIAQVMNFADYDHDGRATEFILQIGTEPCGKITSIVVGISRKNPHLHAFASAKYPKKPLLLQAWQWVSLSRAKGPTEVTDWACGDHGSDVETKLELRAQDGVIHATRRTYECKESGLGRLLKKVQF
jgi:hypothetical protein